MRIAAQPIAVQRPAGERLAGCGDRITFVGHATTLLRLDGITVLTDPVLGRRVGPLRRNGPSPPGDLARAADVVVVSHLHHDHLDLRSLRMLAPGVPLIVPRGAGALASRGGATDVVELSVGERVSVGELTITAVPAEHESRRAPLAKLSAEPLGFLVDSTDRRAYFAGDTDSFPEMASLGPMDLALVPVWGWGPRLGAGHLDPEAAARALTLLRPQVAVPIHWGTFHAAGMRWAMRRHLSQPPLDFARFAAQAAPDVRVRVLQPGTELALDWESTA